jgi:hypothetical protein
VIPYAFRWFCCVVSSIGSKIKEALTENEISKTRSKTEFLKFI